MSSVDEIGEKALQLPFEQREALAFRLLGSLHPRADDLSEEEWAEAWGKEIERRLAAADRGEFAEGDWRDVIARLRGAVTQERRW